jgi:3-methylcrotonyl-CoA carboxylase alpha subunit
LQGHAIEARVCAEDPERDFLPSAGELRLLEWPERPLARVDAGFGTGDRVPESYDSLLGKVIARGAERAEAAGKLAAALERIYCAGVRTNERWLARILRTPDFLQVRHSIAFLESHGKELADAAHQVTTAENRATVIAALAVQGGVPSFEHHEVVTANPWAATDGFTPNLPATVQFSLQLRGQQRAIAIESALSSPTCVSVDATSIPVAHVTRSSDSIAASLEGLRVAARVFVYEIHVHVWLDGQHYDFLYEDPRAKEFSATASRGGLTTPLPGVVVAVAVTTGQVVAAGEVLMVIEAMKMEHTITAPYAGTVQSVHFARGARVPEGSALLELTPAAGD